MTPACSGGMSTRIGRRSNSIALVAIESSTFIWLGERLNQPGSFLIAPIEAEAAGDQG
jgi:hypothetical protein